MEQLFERVAGLDVHRDSVSVCARVPGVHRGVVSHKARYATTTKGLAELADWLGSETVTVAGMESTGVYWKPCFYALQDHFETTVLLTVEETMDALRKAEQVRYRAPGT